MEGIDKVMADLGGEPIVLRAARAFEENPLITEIVIVTREDLMEPVRKYTDAAGLTKLSKIVTGGESRTESVLNGLNAADKHAKLAAIHDAARPLVSQQVITDAVTRASVTGAAAPAVPVKDTIKQADSNSVVTATPDRESLFAVQTPQVFDMDFIRAALYQAVREGWQLTDDCSAAEKLGMKVHLTAGSEENLKVTTPMDLRLAELIWKERQ
ncbi:MAG: 2-C-methyl-D-erythritol 4-phosphate cytidylyltransferase [Oscillospiraceae bacterium]|nr:2-C-methyl-D-erythritol 4-phosphate cytidylyltransferase [Oscillospiraceae bacterium]